MIIIPRKGWGALEPKSRTPWNIANVEGIVQHWFGSPKAAATHAGCDDLLRAVQRFHMFGSSQAALEGAPDAVAALLDEIDWSQHDLFEVWEPGAVIEADGGLLAAAAGEFVDIAYNIGVCPHGSAYELRGWNVQSGANGTTDTNRRFLSFVYMAGVGDPLTAKAKATLDALYSLAFSKGVAVAARTHGSITGSACPGPALGSWLASGAWRPNPPEPKPRVRFELTGQAGGVIARSGFAVKGNERDEKARLRAFMKTSFEDIYTRSTRGGGTITRKDV